MMMLEDTECRVLLEQRWYWLTQSTLFTNSVSGSEQTTLLKWVVSMIFLSPCQADWCNGSCWSCSPPVEEDGLPVLQIFNRGGGCPVQSYQTHCRRRIQLCWTCWRHKIREEVRDQTNYLSFYWRSKPGKKWDWYNTETRSSSQHRQSGWSRVTWQCWHSPQHYQRSYLGLSLLQCKYSFINFRSL